MTNQEFVIMLQKREKELVAICNYNGFFGEICKDVIQDCYIKLLLFNNINRYVNEKGQPNMFIVFAIIKNIIYEYRKKAAKSDFNYDINDINIPEPEVPSNDKYDFIIEEVEKLGHLYSKEHKMSMWFEYRLIDLYVNEGHSIRSLAKDTKIAFSTIQKVVAGFKSRTVEKYEKIKKLN